MRRCALVLGLLSACTPDPIAFVAVTHNTGTTEGLLHDDPPDDGYTSAHAALSDLHYGDGLAWLPAVDAARRFYEETAPDIVGFQETFFSGDCASIPPDAHADFVCETWADGDPTVAQVILGAGYRVACHLEKSDKCLAVKKSFGAIAGCDADLCLDGLDGARVEGCGGGSRIGRARITLTDERALTVVNVHGSSGITADDIDCRTKQFEKVFELADGERNVVLGDFNTDPKRLADGDDSAQTLALRARGNSFDFLTGGIDPPTYAGLFDIDHILTDFATGPCTAQTVIDATYFDHRPIVCSVRER